MARPRFVLKLGGELLEQPADLDRVARGIAALARRTALVVVHGGGREIDAGLAAAGLQKHQVDEHEGVISNHPCLAKPASLDEIVRCIELNLSRKFERPPFRMHMLPKEVDNE